MARKPRIHYTGAVYHVILRGNDRQRVFFDDHDRHRFYLFLQQGVERFRHRIHAFSLMTNHIHLVMQVDATPLSCIMQSLSLRYTRWVNWRHNRSGHLFQGRYKAVLVDGDSFLLELVRYVHLNPVRAKMVASPDEYPWTGHRAYCGKEIIPWLSTELTLSMISGKKEEAMRAYASFVQEGLDERRRGEFHGEGTVDNRIMGDEEFMEKIAGQGDELPVNISIDEVITAVCDRYKLAPAALALPGKTRALSHARGMAAWIIQDSTSVTLTELICWTGRDLSSLSAMAQRIRKRSVMEIALLSEKEEILNQITICKA